jgi:hypothetical protein
MTVAVTKRAVFLALSGALAVCGGGAYAHHSFAQFDTGKTMTIEGTVKSYSWSNPHVWIDMMVKGANGDTQKWGLETQSVGILSRAGWNPTSLKEGDQITVQIHPMKDGTSGGQVMKITFPDGRVLLTGMARPNP